MTEPKPFASLSSGLLARKGTAKPAMRPQGFGKIGSSMDDLGWNDMGHNRAPEPQEPSPFEAPHDEHVPSPISALTPMGSGFDEEEDFEATLSPAPPVVEQQRAAIEARFSEPAEDRPAEDRFVLATKTRKPVDDTESVLELETADREPEPEAEPEKTTDSTFESESAPVSAAPASVAPAPVTEAPAAKPAADRRSASRTASHSERAKAAFTLRLDGDRHLKLRLACAVSGRSAQQLVTEALDQLLQSRPEVGALAEQVPPKSGKLN